MMWSGAVGCGCALPHRSALGSGMHGDDREYSYSLDLGPGWVDLALPEGSKAAAKELVAELVAQFDLSDA
jgi:hypothetical protein